MGWLPSPAHLVSTIVLMSRPQDGGHEPGPGKKCTLALCPDSHCWPQPASAMREQSLPRGSCFREDKLP